MVLCWNELDLCRPVQCSALLVLRCVECYLGTSSRVIAIGPGGLCVVLPWILEKDSFGSLTTSKPSQAVLSISKRSPIDSWNLFLYFLV